MAFDLSDQRYRRKALSQSIPIQYRCSLLVLAGALPALAVAFALLPLSPLHFNWKWTIGLVMTLACLLSAWLVHDGISAPLLRLSGALRSLQEGDYSVRLAKPAQRDVLADMAASINSLAAHLDSQRLSAAETRVLFNAVADEIEAAIFTFDDERRIRLANRAAERLLVRSRATMLGKDADAVGLLAFLERASPPRTVFHGGRRWDVKRKSFYAEGQKHTLVVITDLTKPLRDEERRAWQRLIRVLGHEINNSLTPIRSLSSHLIEQVHGFSTSTQDDLKTGLSLMASRSEALARFISGFTRIADVPAPQKTQVNIRRLLETVAILESRVHIEIQGGPNVTLHADSDQLEQVIINILKNAADAAVQTRKGTVTVAWHLEDEHLRVCIRDDGPGLTDTQNLFVPFFTTKQGGSGVGLALSRQIVEAHGGTILLRNRAEGSGCEAVIELPVA